MKTLTLFLTFSYLCFTNTSTTADTQHGKVYGSKPDLTGMMLASHVEAYMEKKTRINVTIKGKILKVTKEKGGWFTIDAGGGKTIAAHFNVFSVFLPKSLAGKTVIAEGIAQKQITADDMQHLAGDTVSGSKSHKQTTNSKQRLTFEVKGLMVTS